MPDRKNHPSELSYPELTPPSPLAPLEESKLVPIRTAMLADIERAARAELAVKQFEDRHKNKDAFGVLSVDALIAEHRGFQVQPKLSPKDRLTHQRLSDTEGQAKQDFLIKLSQQNSTYHWLESVDELNQAANQLRQEIRYAVQLRIQKDHGREVNVPEAYQNQAEMLGALIKDPPPAKAEKPLPAPPAMPLLPPLPPLPPAADKQVLADSSPQPPTHRPKGRSV